LNLKGGVTEILNAEFQGYLCQPKKGERPTSIRRPFYAQGWKGWTARHLSHIPKFPACSPTEGRGGGGGSHTSERKKGKDVIMSCPTLTGGRKSERALGGKRRVVVLSSRTWVPGNTVQRNCFQLSLVSYLRKKRRGKGLIKHFTS